MDCYGDHAREDQTTMFFKILFCVFYIKWSKEVDTSIGKREFVAADGKRKTGGGAMIGCMFSALNLLHETQRNFMLSIHFRKTNTWYRC